MQLKLLNLYTQAHKDVSLETIQAEVGPGWAKLIEKLVQDLDAAGWNGEIAQVKEKFGGLRFYLGTCDQQQFQLANQAESASFDICEACGAPGKVFSGGSGKVFSGGWIKTLCDEHREKWKEGDRSWL